jgi:hypothetical protein
MGQLCMDFSGIKAGFSRNSPHQAVALTGGKALEIWLGGAWGSLSLVTNATGGNLRQKPSSGELGQKCEQELQAFMGSSLHRCRIAVAELNYETQRWFGTRLSLPSRSCRSVAE